MADESKVKKEDADEVKVKEEPVVKKEESPIKLAPDPDEDDLSDLDDVLDEFAATKINSKAPAPTSSGPGRPSDPKATEIPDIDEEEFSKQLQSEMEQLLGQGDLQKQFEEIMKGVGDTPSLSPGTDVKEAGASSATAAATAEKAEQSFQETIRRTMERMQESGDQASAAAASADNDDLLAQMLKEMENGGFGGEGSDEDFSKILMGMMEQLTNKEILYEPMKELNDKFPKWMEENKEKVPKDDLTRYEEQQTLVREIMGRFERSGYSDSNAADREYIVERMQKMQAAGSPPPDLVGNMDAAQEALTELDQGCPTQ
ncbi:Pex19-domain-containing protein [Zopfia rhizophila CBS 207.26]|uniref:Pex19-domain-containing protein n=1 Tax=Zopfia rhizophila CBS 207.26 TaxID=1314779 RepID=A0A6A6DX64_9PEZI|nr:Pex19-domain-containing protein [Zopfia rhizophila CBS 207.26]